MADTKRAKRDDDTDTTDQATTQDKQGESQPGPTSTEQQGSGDQPPEEQEPALSYAGSGTTDPIKLDPATHGAHPRVPETDI
jgi:hypothetical protein